MPLGIRLLGGFGSGHSLCLILSKSTNAVIPWPLQRWTLSSLEYPASAETTIEKRILLFSPACRRRASGIDVSFRLIAGIALKLDQKMKTIPCLVDWVHSPDDACLYVNTCLSTAALDESLILVLHDP